MGRLLGKISLPGRRRQACARRYLTTLAAPLLLSSEAWRHDACAAGEKHQLSALKFEAVDLIPKPCASRFLLHKQYSYGLSPLSLTPT